MSQKLFSKLLSFLPQIIASLFLAGFVVYAWTEPASPPPAGNVDAPVNVGSASQYKSGALGIGGLLRAYSNAIFDGNVSVGNVTIKGDGSISTNLNADKLDDQHASELRPPTGLYGWCKTTRVSTGVSCVDASSPAFCTTSACNCPAGYTLKEIGTYPTCIYGIETCYGGLTWGGISAAFGGNYWYSCYKQ